MLHVSDVRETRVFQEALEEGMENGMERGIGTVALQMLQLQGSVEDIAAATGLRGA